VMDPLGNILLFVTALQSVPLKRRRRVVAAKLLIAYGGGWWCSCSRGSTMLHALNITGPALTIAGGLVLFLIALRMVFPSRNIRSPSTSRASPSWCPLAIPYVAVSSALATLLLLMSREPQRWPVWAARAHLRLARERRHPHPRWTT